MLRALPTALFLSLFFVAQAPGQDVFVPRELKAIPVTQSDKERPSEAPAPKALPVDEPAASTANQQSAGKGASGETSIRSPKR